MKPQQQLRPVTERRRERRCRINARVDISPLSAVNQALSGQVLNVSPRGLRVRIDQHLDPPRAGALYHILGSSDRMLCQLSNYVSHGDAIEIGFRILHWSDLGPLNHFAESQAHSETSLGELSLPGLKASR